MADKIVYSIDETAERTGLPYHVIRQLCLQGQLRYVRPDTRYWVDWQSVLHYLGHEEDSAIEVISDEAS